MFQFTRFPTYGYVFTIRRLRFAQPGFPIQKSPDQSSQRKRKQHVISKVAASEMERGQTGVRACRGSDRGIDSVSLMERFWESLPKRVKAPYMKDELTRRYPEYHETRETLWEHAGTTP